MNCATRCVLILATLALAAPAGGFALFPGGRGVGVLDTLQSADRWSSVSGLSDGIQVGIAPDFATDLGATPSQVELVHAAVVDAFAAWENPELRFEVSFEESGVVEGAGFGLELDVFAVDETHSAFGIGSPLFGLADPFAVMLGSRPLTNGQAYAGYAILGADIFINITKVEEIVTNLSLSEAEMLAALQQLLMHEIGHAFGLGHPNENDPSGPGTNYDQDLDPLNPMPIDPLDPFAGIVVSADGDNEAAMSNRPCGEPPVLPCAALFSTLLTNDDIGGRDVLYPVVPAGTASGVVSLSVLETPGQATDVEVVDGLAYVTDGPLGLRVIDVSDPAAPVELGSVDTPGEAGDVETDGLTAYVADGLAGIRVIDVSDPAAPVEIGFFDTAGYASDVEIDGTTAYVADGSAGVVALDISDPALPTQVASVDTPGSALEVGVWGGYLFVADAHGGLLDYELPSLFPGSLNLGVGEATVVEVDGDRIIAADHGTAGMSLIDLGALLGPWGSITAPDRPSDVAVSGDLMFLADRFNGVRLLTFADPIVEVGGFDTPGEALGVAVSGSRVYVADGTAGLRILSLEQFPDSPGVTWERGELAGLVDASDPLAGTLSATISFDGGEEEVAGIDYSASGEGLFTGSFAGGLSGTWEGEFWAPAPPATEVNFGGVSGTYQYCEAGTEQLDPCTQPVSLAVGNKIVLTGPVEFFSSGQSPSAHGLHDLRVVAVMTVIGLTPSGGGFDIAVIGSFQLDASQLVAKPVPLDFGGVTVGIQREATIDLENLHLDPQEGVSVEWVCNGACAELDVQYCIPDAMGELCDTGPGSLPGGDSAWFRVRWTPSVVGVLPPTDLLVTVHSSGPTTQFTVPLLGAALPVRATPFIRWSGELTGSVPTTGGVLPAEVYLQLGDAAATATEHSGFASLVGIEPADFTLASNTFSFSSGGVRPGAESFVASHGGGAFGFYEHGGPLVFVSGSGAELDSEYATPGGVVPQAFAQIERQGIFALSGHNPPGFPFFQEVGALTGGTRELSYRLYMTREAPRQGATLDLVSWRFPFVMEMLPVVPASMIAVGQEQTATLLGGTGQEGGLEVTLTSSTGGTLSAEYKELTPFGFQQEQGGGFLIEVPGLNGQYQLWQIDFDGDFPSAEIVLHYEEPPPGIDELAILVWHEVAPDDWDVLPSVVDPVANTITVTVTSFSPFVLSAGVDTDQDGLSDTEEAARGTNASNADSDGDGLIDGLEVWEYGADPLVVDSDGDGWLDGVEHAYGGDPADGGVVPPVAPKVTLSVFDSLVGEAVSALEVEDYDLDGTPDLIYTGEDEAIWLQNQGDGSFWSYPFATLATGPIVPLHSLASADFDGDTWPDIAVQDFGVATTAYLAPGQFLWDPYIAQVGSLAWTLAQGDVDGDGDPDLATLGLPPAHELAWYENQAGGTTWVPHTIEVAPDPNNGSFEILDFDGDGDGDLVSNGDWYKNLDGAGTSWQRVTIAGAGMNTAAGDIDGQSPLDLVVQHGDGTVEWWERSGVRHLVAADDGSVPGLVVYGDLEVVDLDGDGDQDILAASANTVRWLENLEGDGSQWAPRELALVSLGRGVEAVDFDGDGDLEVWIADGGLNVTEGVLVYDNQAACENGLDDDGDGLFDWPDDPGCDSAMDILERSSALVCDDGLDNDGDGFVDHPGDPGCGSPSGVREAPQCQDGLNNDGQLGTDFDGGVSAGVTPDPDGADPNCSSFADNKEAPTSGGTCGLGVELVLLLPILGAWRARRRRLN